MSKEWISPCDALEILQPGCNCFSPTTMEAICQYAAAGKVRARAAKFTVEGLGRAEQSEDRLIPERFWQVTLEKANWRHAIFVSVERGTDLNMGVEWTIRCEALEVYFERKGIEAMKGNATTLPASPFSASLSTAKQVRGRPRGSGSYAASDALFVAKMREYITKHPGASATTAAEQFVNEIAGGATPATKVRRVVGKYRKTHPN